MDENRGDARDLLGDQIGWAVRQLLPPTPELKALDKKIMQMLPRPIARTVALIRFKHGWLPEMGSPDKAYYGMLEGFVRSYLSEFGQRHNINTVIVTTSGEPLKIHPEDFSTDQEEKSFRWDKQVGWALRIQERKKTGDEIQLDDLKEATTILYIQNEMGTLFQSLKPQFIKRGLPFPWLPKEITATNRIK